MGHTELLNFEDNLTLIFEECERFNGRLLFETESDPEDAFLNSRPKVSAMDGSDLADDNTDDEYRGDLRNALNRSRYEIIKRLRWIQELRQMATKYGLDTLVRNTIIDAISPERYAEISAYDTSEKVKSHLTNLENQGKLLAGSRQALEKSLLLKGKLTIHEIETLFKAFDRNVKKPVRERRHAFMVVGRRDPKLAEILSSDVHQDIDLEFEDITKPLGHEERTKKHTIAADLPLAQQIKEFNIALSSTHPPIAHELTQKFIDAYNHILKELKGIPELSGPKEEGQRVYTATLYALHKVAPNLNITVLKARQDKEREAQEKQAEIAKKKQEQDEKAADKKRKEEEHAKESARKAAEKLAAKAEKDYQAAVQLVISSLTPDKKNFIEAKLSGCFHKPIPIHKALDFFDTMPNDPNYVAWSEFITSHLGIQTRAKFEAAVTAKTTPAQAPVTTPTTQQAPPVPRKGAINKPADVKLKQDAKPTEAKPEPAAKPSTKPEAKPQAKSDISDAEISEIITDLDRYLSSTE